MILALVVVAAPMAAWPNAAKERLQKARTHLSRLIDDAHAGETILLAKPGKPWARLMPLAPPPPRPIPGRLRGQAPPAPPRRSAGADACR